MGAVFITHEAGWLQESKLLLQEVLRDYQAHLHTGTNLRSPSLREGLRQDEPGRTPGSCSASLGVSVALHLSICPDHSRLESPCGHKVAGGGLGSYLVIAGPEAGRGHLLRSLCKGKESIPTGSPSRLPLVLLTQNTPHAHF